MEEEGELRGGPDDPGYLLVRINVPELSVQKCLQFPRDQLVWDVKQQCLAALPKVTFHKKLNFKTVINNNEKFIILIRLNNC